MLETVVDEQARDRYTTLISATGNSFIDGFLETCLSWWMMNVRMNKKEDRLLVISNGFSGDDLVKYAFEKGYKTEWVFHSLCLPMDAKQAAQDAVYHEGITHVLFVSVDAFSGALTPLRQILPKMRKMRKDVSVCVDNRHGFCLQPLPRIDEIIDYSVSTFESHITNRSMTLPY